MISKSNSNSSTSSRTRAFSRCRLQVSVSQTFLKSWTVFYLLYNFILLIKQMDFFWSICYKNCFWNFTHSKIQKHKKIQSSCWSFLYFWDLHDQKLLLKCLWNWLQVSISSMFYGCIFCTKVCSKPKYD